MMQTHDVVSLLTHYSYPVNFISHLLIFTGAFYILLHNRNLPRWHVTPLWWAGCASMLAFITIVLGLFFGDDFVFSYFRFGLVAETLFNACIASIAVTFLWRTVKNDLCGRKQRATKRKLK